MSAAKLPIPVEVPGPDESAELSLFQRIADKVSYGMGTPTNIVIWILAVGTWIALGPVTAFCRRGSPQTGSTFPSTPSRRSPSCISGSSSARLPTAPSGTSRRHSPV